VECSGTALALAFYRIGYWRASCKAIFALPSCGRRWHLCGYWMHVIWIPE